MIGSEITKIRKNLLMVQEHFSQLIGATPSAISRWETGNLRPSAYFESLLLVLKKAQENDIDIGIKAAQVAAEDGYVKALYTILKAAFEASHG